MLAATLVPCATHATTKGATPLPYQSTNKHLGVATCASSVCHGSVTPSSDHDVQLDEFVTWSHEDKHSRAYAALTGEKGRAIAAKLGIADARTEKACLDCHSDNVPTAQRGSGFSLSDGVSCEACHGGAGPWLVSHASRGVSYRDNIARGMYPTAQLRERAALCIACHFGNEDKFATHRLMGAGHPRLSFELDTFLALQPPHYQVDADYQKRKPAYPRVQVWAYGELAAAQRQLEMMQGPLVRQASFLPELALLDCHACHENPLHRLDWSRGLLTRFTQPGSVPIADGHLKMALIIARRVDDAAAKEILSLSQALQKATGESRERVAATSGQLAGAIERTLDVAQAYRWTRADAARLLADVVELGSEGEYRDYISAEQAVMAIDLLMIDIGVADRYRKERDELYRALRNDDAYQPAQLRDTLTQLSAALRRESP
jgi:hypothetical protein